MNTLVVFLGGGIGALLRYWLSGAVYRYTGSGFPFGTMAVNILGSFAIGLILMLTAERFAVSPTMRVFLSIGVLGGFTTFSTFSYEAIALFNEGSFGWMGLYVLVTMIGCLAAAWLGLAAAKLL
jgi:CrcB protein